MRSSPAIAMVRALRLFDPRLCEIAGSDSRSESSWLPSALLGQGLIDEERAAKDVCQDVLRLDEDPIDGLFALARTLVDFRNGVPHCVDTDLFHQIGYEIDTDLLVAARLAQLAEVPKQRDAWIRKLSWPSVLRSDGFAIETVLSREIVDSHVHLGGALPGSFYWLATMAGYARLYRTANWCPTDPERWPKAISVAARKRHELYHWLRWNERLPPNASLPEFFAATWTRRNDEPFCDYILRWLIPDDQQRVYYSPILGERWMLWQALWTCRWSESSPWSERGRFIDYLKKRNSFIRYLSHGPGVRGLERFQTTFRRQHLLFDDRVAGERREASRQRRARASILGLERFRVRHALRYQFSDPTDAPWARDQGAGLPDSDLLIPYSPWRPPRQVELRVTPILGNSQLRVFRAYLQGLRDFVVGERDAPLIRVGFVFHVHRHADARAVETAQWQIKGLLAALDDVPRLRPFIVGIDAAGAEMATAPRELHPCYRLVLRHDRKQSANPGLPPVQLGRTCHAGEDFRDLLTGLRYVDEAVMHLDLRAGDRIGHGIAIALSPAEWYARRPNVHPLLRDHVLDLLWGRFLAQNLDQNSPMGSDAALDNILRMHLERVIREADGFEHRIDDVVHRFNDCNAFPSEKSILSYLGLDSRQSTIAVPVDNAWIGLVTRLRTMVISRFLRSEVVIEVCPTSNLLIGGFHSYARHPYLNLNHAHLPDGPADDPQLPLSINTDDPGTFRTTIANEYRLLGEALVRAGHRRRNIAQWLEEARRVGVESTFIPRWSPPTRPELLYWLSSWLWVDGNESRS